MRHALKLLLLLGVGLLTARPKGGDGPEGPDGNDGPDGGDSGEIDPLTGRPKDSAEREERLNFQGKNASTEMAEVHDTADAEAKDGRGSESSEDSSSSDDTDSTNTQQDPDIDRLNDRIDNVKEHLQYKDLDAARRELNGEVVATKSDGTPWDHVHEVRDAQNALMNIIDRAKRKLDDSRVSDEDKAAYEALLSQASTMLDYSEGFVPRG